MLCKCVKSLNAIRPTSSLSSLQLERRRVGGSRAPLRLGKRRVSCLGLLAVPPFGRTERGPGHVPPRGRNGVREFLQDLDETFAEIRIEIAEARDLGDRALFLGRFHGRGKESGADTRSPIAYLVDFSNGRVTRVVSYLDHREALEAAGLSE